MRTRQALGEAAIALFLTRGFDRTTIEDIVAEAGVSRRTFFRYFPTKEAAFFAELDSRLEAFVAQVSGRVAARGAWDGVVDTLLEIAVGYEADREGSLAWRRAMRSSPSLVAYDLQVDATWEAEVAKVFAASGDAPFEAAARAGAVMGVVRAVLVAWHESGGQGDLVKMGGQAFAWLASGMGGPPPWRAHAAPVSG